MRIAKMEDELYLIPTVADQNDGQAISFKWKHSYNDRHVFANQKHDFPQYISYALTGEDTLQVIVWGKSKGETRESQFNFIKE